ncbi:MAG: hypothetical protein R3B96_09140 [Pirellulaceae bacterium]
MPARSTTMHHGPAPAKPSGEFPRGIGRRWRFVAAFRWSVLIAFLLGGMSGGESQAQESSDADALRTELRLALDEAGEERFEDAEKRLTQLLERFPNESQLYYHRGRVRYCLGEFAGSVSDFDAYYEAVPAVRSRQWERGISLYFAERFRDGAAQFAEYQTYHNADVENAAWRYLCEAKFDGPDTASRNLMPVGPDRRVPMMKIHELYGGKARPEDVLAACATLPEDSIAGKAARFYAHLYIGLWYESREDNAAALPHLLKAAHDYPIDHYMGWVAKVHPAVVAHDAEANTDEAP